jgi:hypothetical protein
MALKKFRQELRNYFLTGLRPTANNFADLIESNLNILDDKATDIDITTGTSDDKFVTVLGAIKVARNNIKVNGIVANQSTGDIQVTSITGNAATATKLATTKNINGIPFDGSMDITLPAITTISGNAATATKLATARTINGVAFDGSQDINIPSTPRIIRIPLTIALLSNALAQNTFASITLGINKTYLVKGKYLLGTGVVSHTTSIGFGGGTIAITSMEYVARVFSSALNTFSTTQNIIQVSSQVMKVLNAANTAATTTIEFEGVLRTGATGATFVPQLQFGTAPTGTNVIKNGSFIELSELGINTIETIG